MVACLEEIAWRNGWIGEDLIKESLKGMGRNEYASYIGGLLK
jgi:dTDP-glucose pyrophosphorylase